MSARRFLLSMAVASLVVATPLAQQPAPPAAPAPSNPAPAAPAAAQEGRAGGPPTAAPTLVFAPPVDAAVVIFTVKAEGASDFEAFFAKVKEGLAQGAKPEYQSMAAGWSLFRVTDMALAGQVLYAAILDPVVPATDYDPVKVLMDALPAEAAALYPKLKNAVLSVNRMSLQSVSRMKQ